MEIGGLLNSRLAAAADVDLGHHLQHPMQMDAGGYGLDQPQNQTMNHHPQQTSMHGSNVSYQNMQQPTNSHIYTSNYDAHQHNDTSALDDDFGAIRPKGETAPKAFACSTCQKGFARRSDLARHGTLEPP
jgi:hypothetical protein